jgi:hypothetical protein
VLEPSASQGVWDAGAFSESRVTFVGDGGSDDGTWYLFYTGATGKCKRAGRRARPGMQAPSIYPPWANSDECESIGFATSTDGIHFTPNAHNPIALYSNATACSKALAEVRTRSSTPGPA